MVQAQGAMGPVRRLLILLLVALQAWGAQAALLRAWALGRWAVEGRHPALGSVVQCPLPLGVAGGLGWWWGRAGRAAGPS